MICFPWAWRVLPVCRMFHRGTVCVKKMEYSKHFRVIHEMAVRFSEFDPAYFSQMKSTGNFPFFLLILNFFV